MGHCGRRCCHPFGDVQYNKFLVRSMVKMNAYAPWLYSALVVMAGHQGCRHHCASPSSLFWVFGYFAFRRLALFQGGKKTDQLWQNAVWVFGYPTSLRRRRLAPYSTVLCKGQFQGEKNIQPLLTLPFVLTAFVTLLYASIFASVKRFALHLYKGASLPQLIA